MTVRKWHEEQLKFDLDLDEIDEDAQERVISAEEARLIAETARRVFENGERPGWFQDYLQLIEQGWPWRVAGYMAWAASPKEKRWPETLQLLATEVLGLKSARAIYTWRRKHAGIEQVVAMLQSAPLWEHRRDVLDALTKMAKQEDYKAFNDRKLFLEMIGDYTPKSKVELGKSGAADEVGALSDDELRAWLGSDLTPNSSADGRGEQAEVDDGE